MLSFAVIGKFFAGVWGKVAVWGAIALGILIAIGTALGMARKSGADAEKVKEREAIDNSRKVADEIDRNVHNADDATRSKLRDKWSTD